MNQMPLTQRTQLYFKMNYKTELTQEQTRIAMMRLMQHYKWLAKWHLNDKLPASSALSIGRGEYQDAS